MKKFSMIFLGIVILIFTACEFEGNSLVINMNDEKKANQLVNELISSIENKEENNIANVFAKTVSANTVEFDESVSALMDYYTGNLVSCNSECEPYSSGVYTPERTCEYIYCSYSVKTDRSDYYFYLNIVTRDTVNADNIGIYSLYVIEQSKYDNKDIFYSGDGFETPGINIDKTDTNEKTFLDISNKVIKIINDKNVDELKSLFSAEDLKQSSDFDEAAQELFEFCENAKSIKFGFDSHNVELTDMKPRPYYDSDKFFITSQVELICQNKICEFFMEYCILDSAEPQNQGITTLRVADKATHPDIMLEVDLDVPVECGIYVVK